MNVNDFCAPGDVAGDKRSVHHAYMAKLARRLGRKPQLRRTYMREWREYRGLSLETTAERVGDLLRKRGHADGYTHATLGRLERGEFSYKQDVLEALADVLQTDVGSLTSRAPSESDEIWGILAKADASDREKIAIIAKTIVGKPTR